MAVKKASKKGVVTRRITPSVANKIQNINTQDWVYVSPKNNMWSVRKEGAVRATRVFKQRTSAVNAAVRLVDSLQDSQVIVYNLQGEISKIIK